MVSSDLLFEIKFVENWDKFFLKLDKPVREKIWKKIQKLKTLKKARHLKHGLDFFVLEIGQYRICFKEKEKVRIVAFVGNHKQYENWLLE